jgi:predicted RNA-binding protein
MVVVAFQIAFRAEIHVNDFFYFLKIIFDISTSKRSKSYKPHSILAKKKFFIRSKAGSTAEPNRLIELKKIITPRGEFDISLILTNTTI